MGIENKSSEIRYWTWYMEFSDGDVLIKQAPFIHELQFELQNTIFRKNQDACRNLLQKGEHSWIDENKVHHTMRIESAPRETGWVNRKKMGTTDNGTSELGKH